MTSWDPEITPLATGGGGSYPLAGGVTKGRAYVLTSAGAPSGTTPTAGGAIDGVAHDVTFASATVTKGVPATPGMPVKVEAGGNVSDGDDLEVQADGQFVTASTGTVVARALEGASLGSFFWAVFV